MRISPRYILCICLAAFVGLGSLSALAKTRAYLDRNLVRAGEPVSLTIHSDGAVQATPDLSVLHRQFTIAGTGRSSRSQTINGVRRSATIWRIQLLPRTTGRVELPSIAVGHERTEPMVLMVETAPSASGSERPNAVPQQPGVVPFQPQPQPQPQPQASPPAAPRGAQQYGWRDPWAAPAVGSWPQPVAQSAVPSGVDQTPRQAEPEAVMTAATGSMIEESQPTASWNWNFVLLSVGLAIAMAVFALRTASRAPAASVPGRGSPSDARFAPASPASVPQVREPEPDAPSAEIRDVLAACMRSDAQAAGKALLTWAQMRWPDDPPRTLSGIAGRLPHAAAAIKALEASLYGGKAVSWSGAALENALRDGASSDRA